MIRSAVDTRVPAVVVVVFWIAIGIGGPGLAQDWPQFLGPNRDGRYSGPPIAVDWPGGSPKEVWRRPVGEGFAGPVVAGDRVFVFHRLGDREVLDALAVATGEPLWRYEYPTTYRDDFGFDEGPRAAPVVVDDRIVTFGAQGQLHVVSAATGERLWSVDTRAEFQFRKGFFGAAGSPLVENGRVMANIGGSEAGVVAFDLETGDVLWMATNDEASYSSGVGAEFAGVPYAVFFTRNFLFGLDPANGAVRFQRPWRARMRASVNAASPLVVDDLIFVSAQYGTGAGLFRVEAGRLQELWVSDDVMSNHYATSVYDADVGALFGFHGRQEYGPSLRAVDLTTGEVHWNVDRFGAGTVTLAGDRLVIMRESGELVIADASLDGYAPLASTQVLSPTVRAYPALANGFLYVRNVETLIGLDLRGR